jgi:hypothetical protein
MTQYNPKILVIPTNAETEKGFKKDLKNRLKKGKLSTNPH